MTTIIVPHNFHISAEYESTMIVCHSRCNEYDFDTVKTTDIVQQFVVKCQPRRQILHCEEVFRPDGKLFCNIYTVEYTWWFEGSCDRCGHHELIQVPERRVEKHKVYK